MRGTRENLGEIENEVEIAYEDLRTEEALRILRNSEEVAIVNVGEEEEESPFFVQCVVLLLFFRCTTPIGSGGLKPGC